MAKTIGLNIKIQSQGGEKVIKNINELESEIEKLQNEIKGLDFGSKEFEEASANLGKLKAGLRDVDKQVEGLDKEQSIQAFSAAINGVTGAFLIASSAARTFGADAQTVEEIQIAEQKALEAVNIALGVQAIAETLLQREKIITLALRARDAIATGLQTAAQTAYTAAVGASTGAMKAFRIALATTGVGALVVGIGFLIEKLLSLNSKTEEAGEKIKQLSEYQLEAKQSAVQERIEIENLTAIINENNTSLKAKEQAYKELQDIVPELTGLTLEEALATGKLNSAVEKQIELIQLRARARALEDYLVEAEKRKIAAEEEQRANEELTESLAKFQEQQEDYARWLKGGGIGTFDEYIEQQEKMQEGISKLVNELNGQTDAVEETTDAFEGLDPVQRELLELQQKILELTSDNEEAEKKATTTTNKNTDAINKYNKALEERLDLINQVISKLKEINFDEEASAKILEDANELLDKQNELIEERARVLGIQIGVNDDYTESLRRLVGGVIIPDDATESAEQLQDVFKKVLDNVIKVGQNVDDFNDSFNITADGASEFLFILKTAESNFQRMLEAGLTFEEAVEAIQSSGQGIYNSFQQLNDEQKSSIINFLKSQEQARSIIDDLNDGITKYNEALKKGEEPLQTANSQNLEIFNLIVAANDALANRIKNLQTEEEVRESIESQVAKQLFNQEDLTKLSEEQLKVVQGTTDLIFDQAKFYGDVLKVNQELAKVTSEISDNITEQSEKLTEAEFGNLFEKIKNDAETNLPALKKFFSELSADTSNLTQEQLDNINTFLDEFTKGLNNSWESMSWGEKVQQLVQVMNDLTSKIQGIAQAQISLELERLAAYEKQTLAIIGDETEAQREKQREFQEEINKQRFELEKKARIQELQFAVASSIAGGAQAVVNALALPIPPPGPQIVAALYAGLTAVEIATINDQLNFVKSSQFVARRGGLVNGPSHEMGGVMMNGGLTLEGGEFIVNRNATAQYADILSQINTSTGGRALAMDDSRIVQEIRKQNQRPIKTYVMYEDIKNTNKINAKLEEISRL